MVRIAAAVRRFHARDREWLDRTLQSTPFHPSFWARRRLDHAVRTHARQASGLLLDVGCGQKPYENSFSPYVRRYVGLELSASSGYRGNRADVYGTATALPIRTASVDTVLCTEVLEHVSDPDATVAEISRVLRQGGIVITTAPFAFPVHDSLDFFRYSAAGVSALMTRQGLEVEEVLPLSGTAVTLALLVNVFWFDIGFMWTKWLYPVGVLLRPILLLLVAAINVAGGVAERALPSGHLSFNHLTLARKARATSEGPLSATIGS